MVILNDHWIKVIPQVFLVCPWNPECPRARAHENATCRVASRMMGRSDRLVCLGRPKSEQSLNSQWQCLDHGTCQLWMLQICTIENVSTTNKGLEQQGDQIVPPTSSFQMFLVKQRRPSSGGHCLPSSALCHVPRGKVCVISQKISASATCCNTPLSKLSLSATNTPSSEPVLWCGHKGGA